MYSIRKSRTQFKFRINNKPVKVTDLRQLNEIHVIRPKGWTSESFKKVEDYLGCDIIWSDRV